MKLFRQCKKKEPENETECILFSSNQSEIYAKAKIICNYNYRTKEMLKEIMGRIEKYIREQKEGGGNG